MARLSCWLCPLLKKKYFLPFMLFLTMPVIYLQLTFPVRYIFKHANASSTCIIPRPNPFDPAVMEFLWDLSPLVCDTTPAILYLDTDGTLQYNSTALDKLGLRPSDVQCQYKIQQRQPYDNNVKFTSAVPFTPPRQVDADFFYVTCSDTKKQQIFDELFASVKKDNEFKKGLQNESRQQLSVLLFGLDSVSRSQSIRKLPKTVQYLKEQLKTYDFQGYMKVGENTLPNLTPLLTGLRAWSSELPITNYLQEPYDSFPFLWYNFSRRGYATLYAEDWPQFTTFNYMAKGFRTQPTDHYMLPFWQGVEAVDGFKSKASPVLQYLENRHVYLQAKSALCYGRKPKHMAQVNYLRQFFHVYKGARKFAFSFLNELCHDYPNFLEYADEDFRSFLQWLKNEGHLENTVLVFFSDHGSRIDKIRNTFVGRIEDRMPMLYIVLPDHIRDQYPVLDKSLSINTQRLSTPYDLHQTIVDVLRHNFESPGQYYVQGSLRGISLFRPLPSDRSCADAWIPENFCACYTSSPVNVTQDKFIPSIAEAIVDNLNSRLSKEPLCEKLTLYEIQEAQLISQGLKHTGTENTGISVFQFFQPETKKALRYLVVLETTPSHGVFEGTVDISPVTGSLTFVGDTVRVNRYGNQSVCINDKLLKPLCFCRSQSDA